MLAAFCTVSRWEPKWAPWSWLMSVRVSWTWLRLQRVEELTFPLQPTHTAHLGVSHCCSCSLGNKVSSVHCGPAGLPGPAPWVIPMQAQLPPLGPAL